MKKYLFISFCSLLLVACGNGKESNTFSLNNGLKDITCIKGKKANGDYPYVTAGNMLYSIGNQHGGFPEIGFHVPGEMAGIWQQPIKLLDGFSLTINNKSLDTCDQFITYPFANQFVYENQLEGLTISRTDFVPDSLPVNVVEYQIKNNASTPKDIKLNLAVNSDLRPVWLGERTNMIDARDTLIGKTKNNTILIKDSLNTWYVGISSEKDSLIINHSENSKCKGKGITVTLTVPSFSLAANELRNIRFYISGSMKNAAEVHQNIATAKGNLETLFDHKKQRYDEIDNIAKITVPDTLLTQVYKWGKYNTDWLKRDVAGLGSGLNAGLPDYPWFFSNDQNSAFEAMLGTHDPQLFYDSRRMIEHVSDSVNNNSGRVIHEVSTNGSVYDKGRMEESQEFITTGWNIFKWTGNMDFLKENYEHGKRVWAFLQEHDSNHNLYIEGYGGVEIEGLNAEMMDVAVGTQVFFEAMSQMALIVGDKDASVDYATKAETLRHNINRDYWCPDENRYADFISDKKKAIQLIDMALKERVKPERNEWAKTTLLDLKKRIETGQHKEKGYIVFYNNGPALSPLNAGITDTLNARKMLLKMPFFTNKFGMYIAGVARPDDITADESSVLKRLKGKEFRYDEAVMQGAGLVIAECKYNGIDSAMPYLQHVLNNFSFATPGSTYEVSPDYGMFVQAWNISGYNIPLIHYIFGVDPMAYKHEVTIKPDMPSAWNFAKLERLLIADTELSIDFKREAGKRIYKITSTKAGWKIKFVLPQGVNTVKVNGKDATPVLNIVELTATDNNVEF